MSCACKVTRYVNSLEKRYGTNIMPTKKTNIRESIRTNFIKIIELLLIVFFIPIIILFLIVRKIFTKKPISIDNLFKLKNKHVRNK